MVNHRQPYREKVSQLISWGHWFALFNILLALIPASRYLLVTDWPATLTGRVYSYISLVGHFSFLVFVAYLLILFPLTFILPAQRLLRFIATLIATIGMTLLLIDSEMFTRFHLHINSLTWALLINPQQSELTRGWQAIFIATPIILLIEMLLASWSWQKLRSLTRRRHYARPLALILFLAFIATHILYIWADANFYRPITMQRANLPLSYPMTARGFLAKHGLLDADAYQQRQQQQGRPDALAIQYPLSPLRYQDSGVGYNLLLLTVDRLSPADLPLHLPKLAHFAAHNLTFTQHFSSGNQPVNGIFGLFYGISPSYMDSVLASRTPPALIDALTHQGYQFGLFASDGFNDPLYRQALIADFSLPAPHPQTNAATLDQWLNWQAHYTTAHTPWFSWLALSADPASAPQSVTANSLNHRQPLSDGQALNNGQPLNNSQPPRAQSPAAINPKRDPATASALDTLNTLDDQIQRVLTALSDSGQLNHTIVVITAATGSPPAADSQSPFPWSRERLHVPLIIHWPGTPAQTIPRLSDHQDIMTTLMRRLLHVNTAKGDFSQGEDLFAAHPRKLWAISADRQTLAITSEQTTLTMSEKGYQLYNASGQRLPNHPLPIDILLPALTAERRFIAY